MSEFERNDLPFIAPRPTPPYDSTKPGLLEVVRKEAPHALAGVLVFVVGIIELIASETVEKIKLGVKKGSQRLKQDAPDLRSITRRVFPHS